MRIALFTETFLPKVDGIVTRLRHTVEHLQRRGDRVLVISPDGGLTEYKGAKIYGVAGVPLPLYPELTLAFPGPNVGKVFGRVSAGYNSCSKSGCFGFRGDLLCQDHGFTSGGFLSHSLTPISPTLRTGSFRRGIVGIA